MKALAGERPRRDDAIPAVVAGAEQHDDARARVAGHLPDGPRDARARLLHERGRLDAARECGLLQ